MIIKVADRERETLRAIKDPRERVQKALREHLGLFGRVVRRGDKFRVLTWDTWEPEKYGTTVLNETVSAKQLKRTLLRPVVEQYEVNPHIRDAEERGFHVITVLDWGGEGNVIAEVIRLEDWETILRKTL